MLTLWLPVAFAWATAPRQPQDTTPWAQVAAALGRTGAEQPGGVYRVPMPRSDLHVTLDGVTLEPALALGSWIAFERTPDGALAMGDLVLTEAELSPVLTALAGGDVHVTAIHHHLLRETPHLVYAHVHARGDPVVIARAVRAALARTGTPPAAPPAPSSGPAPLDTAGLAAALGRHGRLAGAVYQVGVPRTEPITDDGIPLPPAMGVATALNFQPAGPGRVVATGDFVLLPGEVAEVTGALRAAGIEVTAVHNHLLAEEPRLIFVHFWARGDAGAVAAGLRSALARLPGPR
jgi:uncharacterized protein DUF1259